MTRLRFFWSDVRRMPPLQLVALAAVTVLTLPALVPCLLVSLPFWWVRQAGR